MVKQRDATRGRTEAIAEQLSSDIARVILAHTSEAKKPSDRVRRFDQMTPYAVHPIWCAASIMQEPNLPLSVRYRGARVLLWHDVLEDTNASLPADITKMQRRLIVGMTFENLDHEMKDIWGRSREIWLLKLYDKVSNLQDDSWMTTARRLQVNEYVRNLADEVEQKYGDLNIIRLARLFAATSS